MRSPTIDHPISTARAARPHRRLHAIAPLLIAACPLALGLGAAGCITPSHGDQSAAATTTGGGAAPASDAPPLRASAAGSPRGARYLGTAVQIGQLHDAHYRRTAAREFDSLTPENEMKWESIEPRPGKFAFEGGDALVAFAAESQMRVRGHTLVWHSQLAPWVKDLSGEALHAAMIRHVKEVVGHFKGKIAEWDVVNEAIADGASGELRPTSPFTALGPTFIDDAFRAAHEVDPAALLFYNDYEIEGEGTPKSEAAFRLVQRLKTAGVPIAGVGLQMHVDPRQWPTADNIQRNIERFAALGLAVEITEMDVPVGEIEGSVARKLDQQRAITHDIVAACVAVPKCSGITFWGFTDRYSWLNSPEWGKLRGRLPHYPLPFDAEYRPKPMANAIAEAFAGR